MPFTPTVHAAMPSYRWPGYEKHLLGELQRQQYSSQYCDTLLQTEGISVPTHSCVLAALSPYLSHKLSATPPPPVGQKRQLHLQAMKAQTLLKLVGLLYSGELEVKGLSERNDVLAAAHQFGIAKLVEGHSDFRTRGEDVLNWRRTFCRSRVGQRRPNVQDAQVQAETAAGGDESSLAMIKSFVSTGTQTVERSENPGGSFMCDQVEHSLPVPLAIAAQILDVSIISQPQNLTADQNSPPLTCHPVLFDEVTTCGPSSNVVINPTSASDPSCGLVTLPPSVHDDLNSAGEEDVPRESSESVEGIQASVSEEARPEDGGTDGGTVDARKDEACGDKTGTSAEKRPACAAAGVKSVASMRKMMETTHISIKVKLRRRTKGEVWEVVSMQNGDETSLHTSLKQDLSRHTLPQKDLKDVHPPFPTVYLQSFGKPESWCLHTADMNSSERPDPTVTDSDSQPPSTSCCEENQTSRLDLEPPGCGEETDEQIERLLEDIMMGLNILPGFEGGCKKAQQNDAGIQFGFAAPNESGCTRSSTAQNHVQTQRSDATSSRNTSRSESQNSLYPEEPAASSAMTTDFFSSGQKPEHLTLQQEGQSILELLPLSSGTQVEESLSLAFIDDVGLPQCLAPLAPCLPPANRQHLANNSTNTESRPKSFLRQRPWLSEKPQSLKFPFSAADEGENEDAQPCTVKCVKERAVKSNHKRMQSSNFEQNDTKVDSAAPKMRKMARKKLSQDASCSFLAGRESKVDDEAKTVCSGNLSRKKVMVRGRKTATSSSMTSANQSVTEKHAEAVERFQIRTRGFVRRVGEDAKDTTKETRVLTPVVQRSKVVNTQDPSLPKRGPGRPKKVSRQTSTWDSVPSVITDASRDVGSEEVKVESLPKEEQNGTVERECKKRRTSVSEVEGVPPKKTASAQHTDEVLPNDPRHLKSLKKHQTVSLMEFTKLIKQQHSKTRKSREGPKSKGPVGDGGSEVRDGREDGTKDKSAGAELHMQGKEKPNLDDERVRVEDDLWPSSQSEAWSCSIDEDTGTSSGGRPESSSDGCQEGPHCSMTEGQQAASGHRPSLQTAEGTAPPSASADGLIRTSSHLQEEEEEEEEEVDVLLCSPVKDCPHRKCEDGLNSVAVTPDEEEEEIDVTGDEAE